MLRQVLKLDKSGAFKGNVWPDPDFQFNKINLLYGFNGSGKTVLSNVFRVFGEDLTKEERQAIYDGLQIAKGVAPEIELGFEDEKLVPFRKCKKLLVFNSHFVAEHVYDGSYTRVRKFKGDVVTGEHLKNPQIRKIEEELAVKKKQQQENSDELSHLKLVANETRNALSNEWNASIKGHRLPTKLNCDDAQAVPLEASETTLESLEYEMEEHHRRFKVSANKEDIQEDFESIQSLRCEELAFNMDLKSALTRAVSQSAFEKVRQKIGRFKDLKLPHASIQEWYEDGATLLEHSKASQKCPLCDSAIPHIADIVNEYSKYFNEEFTAVQSGLSKSDENLDALVSAAEHSSKDVALLRNLITKYNLQRRLTSAQQLALDGFTDGSVNTAIRKVKSIIARKQKHLGITFTEDELNAIDALMTDLTTYNQKVTEIKSVIDVVKSELVKSAFNPDFARSTAKDLYWKRLDGNIIARTSEYAGKGLGSISASSGLQFYHAIVAEQKTIEKQISEIVSQRARLLAQLKKESEYVNLFLGQLGIANFTIRIPEEEGDDIEVSYRGGGPKRGLRYTLSEGEKTALAFSYFLSKVRYEIIENTSMNLNECIVVIDDPVSSLDENRLFSTAMVIKRMFVKDTRQLFVFSHNLVFLKFLGNILEHEDNKYREDCYLENGQIVRLPKALTNYQTSYFYKIKRIQDFLSGHLDYETAKDLIPNCIRIVLESFLSFKLCRLKHGSGAGHKYQSAGLDKLIPSIDGLSLSSYTAVIGVHNKEELIATLWSIKNKVDPESHGTPQDITDFEFLSESELKTVAQNTLDVIAFMDQIHFQQIQQVTS